MDDSVQEASSLPRNFYHDHLRPKLFFAVKYGVQNHKLAYIASIEAWYSICVPNAIKRKCYSCLKSLNAGGITVNQSESGIRPALADRPFLFKAVYDMKTMLTLKC